MSKSEAGKGSFPRPVNKKKYARNYVRIFGQGCPMCGGKGFLMDDFPVKNKQSKKIKTICIVCNGKGKVYDVNLLD